MAALVQPHVHDVTDQGLPVGVYRDALGPVITVAQRSVRLCAVAVHELAIAANHEGGEKRLVVELARVRVPGRTSLEGPHGMPVSASSSPKGERSCASR